MPTGYTYSIKDGISFKQFVLSCARAFGACIHLRDEPLDTPFPNEILPSPYYQDRLESTIKELSQLLTTPILELAVQYQAEYEKDEQFRLNQLKEEERLYDQYRSMLLKVEKWIPPTPDHERLKEFMAEQIKTSIEHDCNTGVYSEPKPRLTTEQWRANKISELFDKIDYFQTSYEKEVARAAETTAWLQALLASLKEE